MTEKFTQQQIVEPTLAGKRLDQVAASLFPEYSRNRLQDWIKGGKLLVNGQLAGVRDKVFGGEMLSLDAEKDTNQEWLPENITLNVVYEDDSILVLNKPAGLVVHPAAGNWSGTMLNGLLFHYPSLCEVPRAGIVHRLDKETSGLMVVARTVQSHLNLVDQLQQRSVSREYKALVSGIVTAGGTIDEPIGRHPVHRTRQAVSQSSDAREAITHYRVIKKYRAHTSLQVKLETGRTHQIRVHMSHLGYPLIGDPVYGGRPRLPRGASPELTEGLKSFRRQALHACRLGLIHPDTEVEMEWEAECPEDMQNLITLLEQDCAH